MEWFGGIEIHHIAESEHKINLPYSMSSSPAPVDTLPLEPVLAEDQLAIEQPLKL